MAKYKRGSGKTGRVNMRRVEGGWENQHGVVFTDKERRAIKKATDASMAKRQAEYQMWLDSPVYVNGNKVADHRRNLDTMGKKPEFIVAEQSYDLQEFTSRDEFNRYMKKQERIATGRYERDKMRLYKRNFMTSLKNVYGDDAKDVIHKIQFMPQDEFYKRILQDERLEIKYAPSDQKIDGRLDEIRHALTMELKDEDGFNN